MRRVSRDVDFNLNRKNLGDVSEDGKFFTFEGLASTFDRDLIGDVIKPGAFNDSIQRSKDKAARMGRKALIPALFNHDPDKPIGRFVELRETEDGLFAKGELHKGSKIVADVVIPAMESEAVMSMSIGFFIDDKHFEGDTRVIEKLTLFETSLVTLPMNPGAVVTDFKDLILTADDIVDMNIRDIERHFLEGNPVSRSVAVKLSTLLKGCQRDADQPSQRDAGGSEVENVALTTGQLDILLSLKRRPHAGSSQESIRSC